MAVTVVCEEALSHGYASRAGILPAAQHAVERIARAIREGTGVDAG